MSKVIPVIPTHVVDKLFGENFALMEGLENISFLTNNNSRDLFFLPKTWVEKYNALFGPESSYTQVVAKSIFVTTWPDRPAEPIVLVRHDTREDKARVLFDVASFHPNMSAMEIMGAEDNLVVVAGTHHVDGTLDGRKPGAPQTKQEIVTAPIAVVREAGAVVVIFAVVRKVLYGEPYPIVSDLLAEQNGEVEVHNERLNNALDLYHKNMLDDLSARVLNNLMHPLVANGWAQDFPTLGMASDQETDTDN